MLGGPQSPKALLDAVLDAARRHDVAALRELKGEFLSVEQNIKKCVDSSGNTLAHLAIGKDAVALKYVVEEMHSDINAVNGYGKTPLHEAVKHNYVACCEYLLKNGAREVSTHTLSTPFHTAAACGSVQCLALLLEHAAALGQKDKVNESDRAKQTALHKCCFEGDLRVAQWLISKGANVNAADVDGCTPLLTAVKMGRDSIVELLIANRADVHAKDTAGNTGVHLCAARCLPGICKTLVAAGAGVSVYNEEGNSPLHLAALCSRPESSEWETLVMFLVQQSDEAVFSATNGASKTPRDLVPRALVPLFTKEEVTKRLTERKKVEKEREARAKSQHELLQQAIAERRAALAEAERAQREEDERAHRELEDRLRAEDDARVRMEEEAEQKRLEEEEAKKSKKGGKDKGGKDKKK